MSARPSLRLVLVDGVMLALASALALSPFADVYAGWRWAVSAAGALLVALALTLLLARLRWGPILTALAGAVAYLVAGPGLAVPNRAWLGVLPSPDAERTLVTGVVQAWKASLTLPTPLGQDGGVLVVPLLVAGIGAMVAGALLWRSTRPSLAGPVVLAMFAAAAAFGARTTDLPLARGALLAGVLLVWIRWRAMRSVRVSWVRRTALTAAVLAVTIGPGIALASVTSGPDNRVVARDYVEPPLEQLDLKSPLSRYRDYYKNHKKQALFQVEGIPKGSSIRLAAMDTFDGIVWNVSTTDLASGTSAFRRAPASQRGDAITVTIGKYTGPWVPTTGTAEGVTLDHDGVPGTTRQLLLNSATGSLAQLGGVRSGDTYLVDWRPSRTSDSLPADAAADRSAPVPPAKAKIEALTKLVQRWIAADGATTDAQRAKSLEAHFREGYFNDGLNPNIGHSPSGHGAKRIADMLADPDRIVGNDEQYASAMAIAAQSLGLPARVVLGFEDVDGAVTLTGDDIAAWVEIKFVGEGWVNFDPTPDENREPPPVLQEPDPVPQPYVVQPPLLPQEPDDIQGTPPEGSAKSLLGTIWAMVLWVLGLALTTLKVLVLTSPVWGVLLLKMLRRRRRRHAEDPIDQISGGWREVTDHARDLGTSVPSGHTRHESSALLGQKFPESGASQLAAFADRQVFGPSRPTDDEVVAYWADVDSAISRMRSEAPLWRRWLARFSLASVPWRQIREDGTRRAADGWRRLMRHRVRMLMAAKWNELVRRLPRLKGGKK